MSTDEMLVEIAAFPLPPVRTPEEERIHEEKKLAQSRLLEDHLAALMAKRGIKPTEISRN